MLDEALTRPSYETPDVGEAIRVFDGTHWNTPVPAVYLGFDHIADDFFMHRVRSDSGVESSLASYCVFRRHARPDGDHWDTLTKKPRVR